jgi:hypothetical protein
MHSTQAPFASQYFVPFLQRAPTCATWLATAPWQESDVHSFPSSLSLGSTSTVSVPLCEHTMVRQSPDLLPGGVAEGSATNPH